MGYKARAGEQPVKRGTAQDEDVAPAPSEVESSRRPELMSEDVDTVVEDDGSGLAGGASGAIGGSSGMPGHPDAEQS